MLSQLDGPVSRNLPMEEGHEGHGRSLYKHWRYDQKSDPSRSTLWRRKREKRKRDQFEEELSSTDQHGLHLNDVTELQNNRDNALLQLKSMETRSLSCENELSIDNDDISGIKIIS